MGFRSRLTAKMTLIYANSRSEWENKCQRHIMYLHYPRLWPLMRADAPLIQAGKKPWITAVVQG